ncbi:preprotein translocase subunit TatB [Streptomyces sp. NPDC007205]|uniref:preprotein translocase subunit TatB n=1 Tax=Streptomyces sp. NPDC007205 TaxID=3154316 RepID=UPI0033D16DA6
MHKLARLAAVTTIAAVITGGVLANPASANSPHTYTCSNQGGGPNHTVNCSGLITVGDLLSDNKINISVKDINVLNDTQLNTLQTALVNVSDNSIFLPLAIQLTNVQGAVLDTYLRNFNVKVLPTDVTVCVGSICV